jgi:hypothetical protein
MPESGKEPILSGIQEEVVLNISRTIIAGQIITSAVIKYYNKYVPGFTFPGKEMP